MRNLLLCVALACLACACAGPGVYTSRYLTMRDGEKIALDIHLPEGLQAGQKVPAILRLTRYFRSVELRWLLRIFLGEPFDHTGGLYSETRGKFLRAGYAWLDIDVRGSGASTGRRLCPWSPDEIKDGKEIVDWVVSQSWSNGKVGAMGISYEGSTAEFLAVNRHPAVKAVAPRFSVFDGYTDVAYPGGIHSNWFTRKWGRFNRALDRNAPHEISGWWVWLLVTGVTPVQEDEDRSMREAAVREHAGNYDVHQEALGLTFRDDISPNDPYLRGLRPLEELAGKPAGISGSIEIFSPHSYIEDLRASKTAIYGYTGWLDGAYPHSAIKRFMNVDTPGSRLILGPWNHGGGWNINQLEGPRKSEFDHDAELLRFFDLHLKGVDDGISRQKPVRYYTMVEERWKEADSWPPPARPRSFYLAPGNRLVKSPPKDGEGSDSYRVDYTAGTGEQSRWRTQIAIDQPVEYLDRAEQDKKLLTFTSDPLEREAEVTGHPIVHLFLSSSAPDGNLMVYLEDVDEKGKVSYVTEGHLRLIHRKLSSDPPPYRLAVPYRSYKRKDAKPLVPGEVADLTFDLLPTSYLFRKGHSIRLALAGADRDLFAPLPADGPENPPTLNFYRTNLCASRIDLPVVGR